MRVMILIVLWTFAGASAAQDAAAPRMTQERLHEIIAATAQNVRVQGNAAAFDLGGVSMLCISAPGADRMRIIAPVKRIEEVDPAEIVAAMHANFHSVLDVRYAIADGVIYAAFLHPLSPLTPEQIVSAIRQVASARETFGTSYSGGELHFRGF